jgi:hypothetical protein
MGFEDVLSGCIAKWRRYGIALAPPVDETAVHRAWDDFHQRASEDVVRLYTTVGGFAQYEFEDDFFWSLWPWDMILSENSARPGEGVIFCDHSIEVATWELRFEDDRRSSVWTVETLYSDPKMTAPSLESFLRLYLEDPWSLLDARSPPNDDPHKLRRPKKRGLVADKSDPLWDETLDG